ncbi:cation:dicarboxylase symporter family transporter [Marivivens donghaensis]|uniref:Cation:dicarboxylase symporter family transporter n=1 Tax=Marivivens donghaensis TaxID=1699413 RepID=A0ABX0VZH2_9RHOB|nr:cation:dicarboxylase symporter family transporter [Marivivens donghaensis]
MQIFIPIMVFFYAIHASHVVSADDFEALRLLFRVILIASLFLCVASVLIVSAIERKSPLTVANNMKDGIMAGVLAVTEEASLANMLEKIRQSGVSQEEEDGQEVIASLGLAMGRFGMITLIASVLTFTVAVYGVTPTPELLVSMFFMSIPSAVLITGLNGPGVLAAALTLCGSVLGLPIEALLVLVILLEPLLELLLIPVSVTMTNALMVLMTALRPELDAEEAA